MKNRKLTLKIKKAAISHFPENGYSDEYWGDIPKDVEQPAFREGAKWAFKLQQERQVKLLNWLQDKIGTDYSISPNQTYEELIEQFNKEVV